MTRSTRRFWITACGALLIGGAALASEPAPTTGAPPVPATPGDAQICTDESVSAQQREAALRDLGARLSALPAAPSGYRELNRTGLNYGPRSAPSPEPAPVRK